MTTYSIVYCRIPTNYNPQHAAIVEAENAKIALQLLRHQLGDHSGVTNYVYGEPQEYIPPQSQGKIITLSL